MASSTKVILSTLFFLLLAVVVLCAPGGKTYQKIRIHVPVKHHTHVITKVKTVHIGVPIKEKKPHWDESWAYSKKKHRVTLPNVDDFDIDD